MFHARRTHMAVLLAFGILAAWTITTSPRVLGQATEECLGSPATVVGDNDASPGDGKITGTEGPDIIIGTEGDDVIDAGPGDDRVCGLGGNDQVTGGDGFDRVNGGPGDDVCETERHVNCEQVTEGSPSTSPSPSPSPSPAPTTSSSAPQA